MYAAYESIKDSGGDEGSDSGGEGEVGEVFLEWLRWAGRWGKRLIHNTDILRIKIPWKLLEDKEDCIQIEYDGLPLRIPLGKTQTVCPGGLTVRLIPIAEWRGHDGEVHRCNEPWFREETWLFQVPNEANEFRVGNTGEWSGVRGEYGRGVFWI